MEYGPPMSYEECQFSTDEKNVVAKTALRIGDERQFELMCDNTARLIGSEQVLRGDGVVYPRYPVPNETPISSSVRIRLNRRQLSFGSHLNYVGGARQWIARPVILL